MMYLTSKSNDQVSSTTSLANHIVFVDAQVDHYPLLQQHALETATFYQLNPHQDGVDQITELLHSHLATQPNSSALSIHIIAHGTPGCLYLGNSRLSLETLNRYASRLQTWSNIADNSLISLLLYSCNVAVGDAGHELLEKLHHLTGATVAASTTPVGNSALGGNWDLDRVIGQGDTSLAFKLDAIAAYPSILSVALDGVDDYISASPTGVNLATSAFTIEFWAKRGRTNTEEYIFSQGTNETANEKLHVGFRSTNQLTISFYGGNEVNTTATIADTSWHHYAFTYDPTTNQRQIYIDGVLSASDIAPADFQGSGNFEIGRLRTFSPYRAFQGELSEMRVWTTVRSQSQIQSNMSTTISPLSSGLVSYWRLDEGVGTTVTDLAGGDNNGTFNNGLTWSTNTPFTSSGVVQFNVGSVLTQDIIVNRSGGLTDTTQTVVDLENNSFLTQSYATYAGGVNGVGLPDNGLFAANAYHPDIQLAYSNTDNGNNARLISTSTGSFTFSVTQNLYSDIHLAVASTEGSSSVQLTFNYTDGTSQTTSTQTVPDWFNDITESPSLYYLINDMDRAKADGSGFLDDSNPALFGMRFANPNAGKTVQSITVQKAASSGWLAFFGATGVVGLPNQAPTNMALNNSTVNENAANSSVIGTFSTTDPNAGDTFTYTLLTNPGGRFSISGNQLRVADGSLLDYETATSHNITVRVTDAGGLTYDKAFTINVGNVNEAPTGVSLSANSVTENSAGAVVGNLSVTDPDLGDAHTFTVSDSRFEVVGGQLKLKAGASLDYEAGATVNVTVTAKDSGNLTKAQAFTINVLDANDAPSAIALSNAAIDENLDGGVIGTVNVTDQDAGDTHTLTVSDSRFEIVGNQLKLKSGNSLNFEAEPTVNLSITATDNAGLSTTQTLTLTVSNVAETAPTLALDTTTVTENVPGAVIGNVTVTDPDVADSHTFTLSDNRFEVVNGQLKLKAGVSLDAETESTVALTLTATDRDGLVDTQNYTLNVTNINEAPTSITLSGTTIAENADGAIIGTLTVVDQDAGDSQTFTLSDSRFEIVGNQLKLKSGNSLNFEAEPTVNLSVTATDSGGLSTTQAFAINVSNVIETAPSAIALSNTSVLENAVGAVVGAITVTDPDAADSHTFTFSDSRFEVVNGQLKLKDGVSVDFETEPNIALTVTATDRDGLTTTQNFALTVTDINENPPSDITLSAATVAENAAGAVIGNLTVTDADAGDVHLFSVSDSRFEVVNQQLKLKAGNSLDFETDPTVAIDVTATDLAGLNYTKTFTISSTNVNETPSAIALSAATVAENNPGAVVGNLTVTDVDAGDSHTFTVSDNRFEVVSNQLKLKSGTSLDYETVKTVNLTITATDAGGLSKAQAFTVNVTNVNEAPSAIALSKLTVAENAAGAVVGNLTVTDVDVPDTHTFTVSDSRFEVVSNQLKLKAGNSLDFEASPTIGVTVTATDAGGLAKAQAFTLNVTNINEAPTDLTLSKSNINENVAANSLVGTFAATDPDAGDTFTYSLVSGTGSTDNAAFSVSGNQLLIKSSPNFEQKANYAIRVRATDKAGLVFEKPLTITINNVNEAPTSQAIATQKGAEGDALSFSVANSFTDVDTSSGDRLTYSATLANGQALPNWLSVDATTGAVTSSAAQKGTYSIKVTASDQGGLTTNQTFNLTVDQKVNTQDFKEGIQTGLGQLTAILNSDLASASLPILGGLGNRYIPDFLNTLTGTLVNGMGNSSMLMTDFQNQLSSNLPGVKVSLDTSTIGQIEFTLDLTKSYNVWSTSLASNMGLPMLNLSTTGQADIGLNGGMKLTFGFNGNYGFYLNTNPNKTYFGADVSANLSSNFTAKSNVGFLQLDLTNNSSDSTGVKAGFKTYLKDLDNLSTSAGDGDRLTLSELRKGGYTMRQLMGSEFAITPNVGMKGKTSIQGKDGLPSLNFDLGLKWNAFKYTDGKTTKGSPNLSFNNLQLDMGTYITNFAKPVITRVNDVVKPFKPIVQFLNADTKIFSKLDVGGFDGAAGTGKDGKVTVLEIASQVSKWNGGRGIDGRFLTAIEALDNATTALNQISTSDGNIKIDLGSYSIGSVDTDASPDSLKTKSSSSTRKPTDSKNQASSNYKVKNFLDALNQVEGLGFPILTDPNQAINLLLGKDATLFRYDMPDLNFEAPFNVSFPVIWPLKGSFGGNFKAKTNLEFGYDTYGFSQWKQTGYSTSGATNLIDGFYVVDQPGDEINLEATLKAGFGVDVVVAEGKIEGGITGTAGIDLVDVGEYTLNPNWEREKATSRQTAMVSWNVSNTSYDRLSFFSRIIVDALTQQDLARRGVSQYWNQSDGRIRTTEITSRLSRPLDLFQINGAVNVFLDAYASVGFTPFKKEWRKNLATYEIAKFSAGPGSSSWNGTSSNKYISGATIFLDANFNGALDVDEPYTISSFDGTYTLNFSPELYDTNSNGQIDSDEGQIVSLGGFDSFTLQDIEVPLSAPVGSQMITPVTTLLNTLVLGGNDPAQAEAQLKQSLGLPSNIALGSFDPIAAMKAGDPNGAKLMAAHVAIETMLDQVNSLVNGVAATSSALVTTGLLASMGETLLAGQPVDLTNAGQIASLIKSSTQFLTILEPTHNWQQVAAIADQAAKVMAEGNQRMASILKQSGSANAILKELSKLQAVLVSETSKDLQAAAAGTKSMAEVIQENTGKGLEAEIKKRENAGPAMKLGTKKDDVLRGSAKADLMIAGAGDDRILAQAGDDTLAGEAQRDLLEGGNGNDGLNGGGSRDRLIGGKGNDTLLGEGGSDELVGGKGSDAFHFNLKQNGVDRIRDFSKRQDQIEIEFPDGVEGLTINTVLANEQFRIGSKAVDESDRFIFNRKTGALFFDIDGVGGKKQVQFAELDHHTTLTAQNIVIV